MTITISLLPETEAKLRQFAARTGQSVEGFVEQLVERIVGGVNGEQTVGTAAALPASLPSDEALASFRQEVAQSGITDPELLAFFEEVREEVYHEKHGRPGQAL